VAESAYQALLLSITALAQQVAAAQSTTRVADAVKKELQETVDQAKRGWKSIKVERKKRRRAKKRAGSESSSQREGEKKARTEQEVPSRKQVAAELVASPAPGDQSTQQLVPATPPSLANTIPAGLKNGGDVAQVVTHGDEGAVRKRRLLTDSGAAHSAVVGGADGEDEDEEDEDSEGEQSQRAERLAVTSAPASGAPQPILPSSAVAAVYPSSALEAAPDSQAPVVMSCSKFPLAVLNVPVQRQYTMTRKDSKRMRRPDKEALVNVTVRIMGTPDRQYTYFVAKDVCQLICLRKGSVAKAIHDFTAAEKARMPVLCQRSSGSGCTQVLTVLTMAGVQRLMTSSRQPIAHSVLQWLSERVGEVQAGQMPSTAFDPNAVYLPVDASLAVPAAVAARHPSGSANTATLSYQQQSMPPPSATPASALYPQYRQSDSAADVPMSPPRVGLAGASTSLSTPNSPLHALLSQPNSLPLTSISQFANHAFLGSAGMSMPAFPPMSSFGASAHSSALSNATQAPRQAALLQPQPQAMPIGYSTLLSQLMHSSAPTPAAFATQQQQQLNTAGQQLFLSNAVGATFFPQLAVTTTGSRPSTLTQQQTQTAVLQPLSTPQSHLNQLLVAHQQHQQHQQQQQRLVELTLPTQPKFSAPPGLLHAASPHLHATLPFLSAASAASSPFSVHHSTSASRSRQP